MLHHLFRIYIRVFHVSLDAFYDLPQVVRRYTRRHADGNSFGSVNQNIRHSYRKNQGLFFRLVKIRPKIHHVFVQIRKIGLLRNLSQPGFRITHRSRAVPFDGTEIAVPVYKRQSFFKLLGHHDKRVINGAVAVRMIFTHRISHDTRAFPVRLVIANAKLIHIV